MKDCTIRNNYTYIIFSFFIVHLVCVSYWCIYFLNYGLIFQLIFFNYLYSLLPFRNNFCTEKYIPSSATVVALQHMIVESARLAIIKVVQLLECWCVNPITRVRVPALTHLTTVFSVPFKQLNFEILLNVTG